MSRRNNRSRSRSYSNWDVWDGDEDEPRVPHRRARSTASRSYRHRNDEQSSVVRVLIGLTVLIIGTILALPYSNTSPQQTAQRQGSTTELPRQAADVPLQISPQTGTRVESLPPPTSPAEMYSPDDRPAIVTTPATITESVVTTNPPDMPSRYQPSYQAIKDLPDDNLLERSTSDGYSESHASLNQGAASTSDSISKSRGESAARNAALQTSAETRTTSSPRETTNHLEQRGSASYTGDESVKQSPLDSPRAVQDSDNAQRVDGKSQFTAGNQSIPAPTRHRIMDGDTLVGLAVRYYHDASLASDIFRANRSQLRDPDLLPVGAWLTIPTMSAGSGERVPTTDVKPRSN